MKVIQALAWLPLALASPASQITKRQNTFCGDWDLEQAGGYTVYQNLWGADAADYGEQCTTLVGMSGDDLQWYVDWTWIGDQYSVKSYPNAVLDSSRDGRTLGSISSIPTSWSWSYSGSDLIANVAYDLFTGTTLDAPPAYEIMVWLGSLGGAGPISSTGSTIATPNIGGITWDLYYGMHSQMEVYSFVAPSNIENYSGDMYDFVSYLMNEHGLSGDQVLQSAGAGTEPFIGSGARFTTNAFRLAVN